MPPPEPRCSESPPVPPGTGRLVVLWLCWVVLVVFLAAAGIVAGG